MTNKVLKRIDNTPPLAPCEFFGWRLLYSHLGSIRHYPVQLSQFAFTQTAPLVCLDECRVAVNAWKQLSKMQFLVFLVIWGPMEMQQDGSALVCCCWSLQLINTLAMKETFNCFLQQPMPFFSNFGSNGHMATYTVCFSGETDSLNLVPS